MREGVPPQSRIDIPSGVNLAAIKMLLRQGENAGWWGFEEGCIDDAWKVL
jgi:hypothetical protein